MNAFKKMMIAVATTGLLATVGCGLDEEKELVELETEERQTLCEDVEATEEECDGSTVSSGGSDECQQQLEALPEDCAATVGDFEECEEVPLCERADSEACTAIFECYGQPADAS